MTERRNAGLIVRIGLLSIGVAAIVTLVASGAYESLSPEKLRAWVEEAGIWGPIVFVLAFAGLQPFGISGHAFILGAALLWSPVQAFALSMGGALLATSVSFWFARYVGHSWVQRRLPARLRAYDDRLAIRGFRTVVLLRLLFFTFAPLQMMFGISRVDYRSVIAGSFLGLIPVMAVETFFGAGVVAWLTA